METVMTDRDIQQPIPRRSDGKIKVTEYREIIWYTLRKHSDKLKGIDEHLDQLNTSVEKNTKFRHKFNFIGKISATILSVAGAITALLWRLVWWQK